MATKKTGAKRKVPRTTKPAVRKRAAKKAPARKAARKKSTVRKSARKHVAAKKTARRATRKRVPVKRAAAAKKRAAPPEPATSRKTTSAQRATSARGATQAQKFDTANFPCGDDALREATGRSWQEWLQLLDKAGASAGSFDHQQLHDLAMQWVPGVDRWWGQVVSTGYESARGLKEKPARKTDFRASISRTLPVPLFAAFAAWADQTLRRGWLDAAELDFTRLNAGRDIRARWPDGSVLNIRFDSAAPDSCEIVVNASKLADAAAVERAKTFWQEQFERLQAYLRI